MRRCLRSSAVCGVLLGLASLFGATTPVWAQQVPNSAQIAESVRLLGSEDPVERRTARRFLRKHAVHASEQLNAATRSEVLEVRLTAGEILRAMSAVEKQDAKRIAERRAEAAKMVAQSRERDRIREGISQSVGKLVSQGIEGWRELDELVQKDWRAVNPANKGDLVEASLFQALHAHHYPQYLILAQTEQATHLLERYLARTAELATKAQIRAGARDYVAYHARRGTLQRVIKTHEAQRAADPENWRIAMLLADLHHAAGQRDDELRMLRECPRPPVIMRLPFDDQLASFAERPAVPTPAQSGEYLGAFRVSLELDARLREGNAGQVNAILALLEAQPRVWENYDKWRRPAEILAGAGIVDRLRAFAERGPGTGRYARLLARVTGHTAEERRLVDSIGRSEGSNASAKEKAHSRRENDVAEAREFFLAHGIPLPTWVTQHPGVRKATARAAALAKLSRQHAEGANTWPLVLEILDDEELGLTPGGIHDALFVKEEPWVWLGMHTLMWLDGEGSDLDKLHRALAFDPGTCSRERWRSIWLPHLRRFEDGTWTYHGDLEAGPPFDTFDKAAREMEANGTAGLIGLLGGTDDEPELLAVTYLAAELDRTKGEFVKAGEGYRRVLREQPLYLPAKVYLSACLARQGKRAEAERELAIAGLLPLGDMGWHYFSVLQPLENLGRRAAVERECEIGVALRGAYMGDARSHHLAQEGRYAEAVELGRRVHLHPVSNRTLSELLRSSARLHRWQGRAALQRGSLKEAVREFDAASRIYVLEPFELTEDLALLADAGEREGRQQILSYHLRRLRANLAAVPESPLCHRRLAWFLAMTGTDPKEAFSLANRTLERKGEADADCLDVLAEAHSRLGQSKAALAAAEKALALTPSPGPPTWDTDHYHLPTPWALRAARLKRLRVTR